MEEMINNIKKAFKNILNDKEKEEENKRKEKNKKNPINLLILILLGIFLVTAGSLFSKQSKNTLSTEEAQEIEKLSKDKPIGKNGGNYKSEVDLKEYSNDLNDKLKNILALIDGVGNVDTLIYFEGGEEYIPATNINNSLSKTEETDTSGGKRKIDQNNDGKTIVTFNDGDSTKPLITKKKNPKITGVCVVAEGADDKVTELRIVQAVVKLFNLPDTKVQVYPMKK
ncbi:stage III sporulation protein AG [Hathewaya massiliensis]|uniref:stage III sporulation protein AG n=1 Tax=Hathewaya massiliensis TaxID=1964382 RepID=UPI001FAA48CE|nr:stage III sporulation protein AG [Hathewaya massiliensis]